MSKRETTTDQTNDKEPLKENHVRIENQVRLKRQLGLISCTAIITGTVIGSGIFVSPKSVLKSTGSVGLCLTVWGMSGVFAILGALCYAELGSMITKSGGEYTFLKASTPNIFGFLWIMALQNVVVPASSAVKALTCAEYLVTLLPVCGSPEVMKKVVATMCIVSAFLTISFSTRAASVIMVMTTVAKVLACILIAVGGLVQMAQGHLGELPTGFEGSIQDPTIVTLSFYSAYYAFGGWETVTRVTGEVINPQKTLPRALFISISLVITLYLLMNASYLSMMTKQELLGADAVAVVWGNRVLGQFSPLVPLAVVISTFGSAATGLFALSRVSYSAARDGNLPEVISYIQVYRYTPIVSTIWLTFVCIIYLMQSEPGKLINFLGLYMNIFQGMVFLSVLILRWKMPDAPRGYKAPLPVAVFMTLWTLFLVVAPLVKNPNIELLYGLGAIPIFIMLFVGFVYFKLSLPGMDKLTLGLQVLLNVVPPSDHED